ncbi:septum site-determining protein MinC [sulfur-oxidizing endosymbiont of Gigantopelta aegis]|uniref:septum site-determining protein MinC n=1 Tax=sulfur-oxidizing endosymbiont of Gigantopelta aegis TaxID=2794934 RepID=UPI0018DD0430|nr:septum site-determining protein MinC [sulfur-oxidizing endosymbiont of Gigantopelta aegis]
MDKPCFELKGSLFTLTVLQLFENDLSVLETQLKERVKMAPGFFNHTPLVVDLHNLSAEKQDLDFFDLRELLLSLSIIPVGVKGADKSRHIQLEAAGMAVLAEAKTPRKEPIETTTKETESVPTVTKAVPETTPEAKPEIEESETKPSPSPSASTKATKVLRQTIRSGQQIYAPGGDLVIIGSVSTGAEILADGNIHVYGVLRGRALAGVRGDQSAAIFCHTLQAELISIAGIYLLSDDIQDDKIGTSVQISMKDEKLMMESL